MITYDVNLCIGTDNPNKRLAVKCHDTGVNLRVYLQICKHGKWMDEIQPYSIPEGSTAVLKVTKPDKKYCITDGVTGNNEILFEMKPQAFTAPGICSAEVSLFGTDGKRITSGTFYINVPEECICGCDLDSENYIDVMSEQIRIAVEAAARAEAAVSHGPIIQGGTWWLWDPTKGEYVDSSVQAEATDEVDPEAIADGVQKYMAENPVTPESIGALSSDKLPEAVNDALAQAKASGQFDGKDGQDGKDGVDGKDGYTPQKGIDYFDGEPGQPGKDGEPGADGKDYILTEADKHEIAERAAELVDVPEAEIPSALPNPNALTFTGAVNATYDGSSAVNVEIPQGGGGGTSLVKADEVIATGTIAAGVASSTVVETGVTWGQLKAYKEFALIIASIGGNTNLGTNASWRLKHIETAAYYGMPCLTTFGANSGCITHVTFKDEAKQIYSYEAVAGTAYSIRSSTAYTKESLLNPTLSIGTASLLGDIGYVDLSEVESGVVGDDAKLCLFVGNAATTCDYAWKVLGVFK